MFLACLPASLSLSLTIHNSICYALKIFQLFLYSTLCTQHPFPPWSSSNSVLHKALNGVFRPERRLVCPADWVFLVVAYQHFHQPFLTSPFGRKLSLMFQFVTHHFLHPWSRMFLLLGFESKLPGYLIELSVLYNEKVFVAPHILRLVTERTLTTSTINKNVA